MATKRLRVLGNLGGTQEVFIAEYGVTPFAEMEEAYNAGKLLFCRDGKYLVSMYEFVSGTSISFYRATASAIINYYRTATGSWNSKTIELSATKHKEIDDKIGDIDTALDTIIAIQNELIGGDGA